MLARQTTIDSCSKFRKIRSLQSSHSKYQRLRKLSYGEAAAQSTTHSKPESKAKAQQRNLNTTRTTSRAKNQTPTSRSQRRLRAPQAFPNSLSAALSTHLPASSKKSSSSVRLRPREFHPGNQTKNSPAVTIKAPITATL